MNHACGCTADTELAAGPVCTVCGHRDHSADGCDAIVSDSARDIATPRPWYWDETDLSMRLHGGEFGQRQILKAVKEHPYQQPYWPNAADAALIVEAVNNYDRLTRIAGAAEVVDEHARAMDDTSSHSLDCRCGGSNDGLHSCRSFASAREALRAAIREGSKP